MQVLRHHHESRWHPFCRERQPTNQHKFNQHNKQALEACTHAVIAGNMCTHDHPQGTSDMQTRRHCMVNCCWAHRLANASRCLIFAALLTLCVHQWLEVQHQPVCPKSSSAQPLGHSCHCSICKQATSKGQLSVADGQHKPAQERPMACCVPNCLHACFEPLRMLQQPDSLQTLAEEGSRKDLGPNKTPGLQQGRKLPGAGYQLQTEC